MKTIQLGILFLFPCFCTAQIFPLFSPSSYTYSFSSGEIQYMKSRMLSDLANSSLTGKAGKHLADIYQDRFESLQERAKEGEFLFDQQVEPYCQKVLSRICQSNPELSQDGIRLLVSKSSVPNASCLGEGTIVLNLGLLSRLESEAQLAFTLCHELAHYVQNHVNENIEERIATYYSKETQTKLKQIKRSKYNRTAQAIDLLQDFTYDSKRHSRIKETEADSIGLHLFRRCGYKETAPMEVLEILRNADQGKFSKPVEFQKHLGSLGYPMKESWLEYEEDTSFFYGNTSLGDWEDDSLRTHPEVDKRIAALARQLSQAASPKLKEPIANSSAFQRYIHLSEFEALYFAYHSEEVGKALFQSLQLRDLYPDNLFLHAMTGLCLTDLYLAKKEHRLSTKLDINHHQYSYAYNQFLHFFNSLRLRDYQELAYLYLAQRAEAFQKDALYGFAYVKMSLINEKAGSPRELKGQYESRFPNSDYQEKLDQLFD